jgi:hypothetical protein
MKGLIQIAGSLLAVLALLKPVNALGGICAQIVHGNFYDLGSLKSDTGYSLDISNTNGKVLFNMCQFLSFRCPGYNNSLAIFRTDELCIPLTMDSLTNGFNSSLMEIENVTDQHAGINFTFSGVVPMDQTQGNLSAKYNLEMLLTCDPNKTDGYVWDETLPSFNSSNGTITIYGRGATSCPKVSGSFIVEFFDKFSFLTAIIAIIIGIIQCFYGYRLYRPTVFLLGFLLSFMIVILFLFEIWTGPESPSYKGYVIVAFAVIIGIMFGFLVAAVAWVAIVVSGAILGFFLSTFVYTLYLYQISSKPSNLLFYNVLVIGMIIGCIAGYEFQSAILILSCSFTGSYLIVRGISVFVGGFPSELNLSVNSQAGVEGTSSVTYYLYLAAIVILTAAGIFTQRKLHTTDMSAEKLNSKLRNFFRRDDPGVELEDLPPQEKPILEERLLESPDQDLEVDTRRSPHHQKQISTEKTVEPAEVIKERTPPKSSPTKKSPRKVPTLEPNEDDDLELPEPPKIVPKAKQSPPPADPKPSRAKAAEVEQSEGEEEEADPEPVPPPRGKQTPTPVARPAESPAKKTGTTPVAKPRPIDPEEEDGEGEEEGAEEQVAYRPAKTAPVVKAEEKSRPTALIGNKAKIAEGGQKTGRLAPKPAPQDSEGDEEGEEEQEHEVVEEKKPPVKEIIPPAPKKKEKKMKIIEQVSIQPPPTEDREEIQWSEEPKIKTPTSKKPSPTQLTTAESESTAPSIVKKKNVKAVKKVVETKIDEEDPEIEEKGVKPEPVSTDAAPKKKITKKKVVKKAPVATIEDED